MELSYKRLAFHHKQADLLLSHDIDKLKSLGFEAVRISENLIGDERLDVILECDGVATMAFSAETLIRLINHATKTFYVLITFYREVELFQVRNGKLERIHVDND